ncbi:dienelactone hydrolase family protein [Streptomyces sp. RB6PN25]|uniref:Dienelactone hydrolase family protein n=1 Tax=Streptomyces humicola TaxID=2953240 RepID=A0ABT1Q294_9ACTN|nr:dienelactone hydrolase family protein [Streptomyces humicola]MCQ4084059.1 dienelactone hydrolase family protein [Streptomyces humicola]
MYDAMMAETVRITGHEGDELEAYLAWPLTPGTHGGVVVLHSMSGYDNATKQITRWFAVNGYAAICLDLHHRHVPGLASDGSAALAPSCAVLIAPDEQVVGDVEGAVAVLRSIPSSNGKVGVVGYCSGGRQAFLTACRLPLDAAVDCYGPFVVGRPPDGFPLLVEPVIGLVKELSCPLLGLFGAEDSFPSPAETAELETELTRHGKPYEFHTYDGAGHGFFAVDRPSFRPQVALDGRRRIREFFARTLAV